MAEEPRFEESAADRDAVADSQLVVSLEGYEGPIDILLDLARDQKVDLTQISILQLANQYLDFIANAHNLRLEIAADYLVMAAWLAYLKSRLLLPQTEEEAEGPSGEAMAEALRFQLQRLEAMRETAQRLMARPQLGVDVFQRGAPEGITVIAHRPYEVSLYELLKAYADQRRRTETRILHIPPLLQLYSIEDAIERLKTMLGGAGEWRTLFSFLPAGLQDPLMMRSALASTLSASLEMVRTRRIELRQNETFGTIYVRKTQTAP